MDVYLGTILQVAFNYAPQGWALCNGQSLSANNYSALYALIGNTYGGDQVNFKLPDLCGRVPVGVGPSLNPTNPPAPTYSWAQRAGSATAALSISNLPAHTHSVISNGGASATASLQVCTDPATASVPSNGMVPAALKSYDSQGSGFEPDIYGYTTPSNNMINIPAVSLSNFNPNMSIGVTGANVPFNVMNPFIAMYYIIAIEGLWPSRP